MSSAVASGAGRIQATPDTKRQIAREVLSLWRSFAFTQAVTFLVAIFIRERLGPVAMGIWSLVQLAVSYSSYASLGVYDGASREIPLARGRGDQVAAERLRDSSFSFVMATSLAASLAVAAWALSQRSSLSAVAFWGWMTAAAINLLQRWNNFAVGMLYVDKLFERAGRFRWLSSLVNAGLTLALVWYGGLYGLYAAMVLSFVFNILYLRYRAESAPPRLRWDSGSVRQLLWVSAPLLVSGLLHTVVLTLDKIVVARVIGLEALGHYTLATLGTGYVMTFANLFSVTLYPRVLERYGKSADARDILAYAKLPGLLLSAYLSAAVGLLWCVAPWLTLEFLPSYTPGLEALRWLLFSTVFFSMVTQLNHVVTTLDRQRRMIAIYAAVITVALGAYAAAYASGGGLGRIAGVTCGAFGLLYVCQLALTLHGQVTFAALVIRAIEMILPVCFVAGSTVLMDRLAPVTGLMSVGARAVLMILPAAAVIAWVEPQLRILPTLRLLWSTRGASGATAHKGV